MAEIADGADLARSSLYRHYKNKREIVECLLRSQQHHAVRLLQTFRDDRFTITEKLEEFLTTKFKVLSDWGDEFLRDLLEDEYYNGILNRMRQEAEADFKKFIAHEQKRGNLRDDYDAIFMYNYLLKLQCLIMDKDLQKFYPDLAATTRAVLQIALEGMRTR
jgi:AcrR family transcriptional regulator